MTPEELRASMPALEEVTYLNTGAGSPTPVQVVEAVQGAVAAQGYEAPAGEGMYAAADRRLEAARADIAAFLGAETDDIALTQSTTDGINRVAAGLPPSVESVVRTDLEHPAGTVPFDRLAQTRDLDVHVHETEEGRLDPAAFGRTVASTDADMAVFSAVDWGYGRRHPVAEAVAAAQAAGARVLVDGVQAIGQFPLDITEWGADFVATAGHKWCCGPWGAGVLYAMPAAARWLVPEQIGHRSLVDPEGSGIELHDTARRLEGGSADPSPHVGLAEAMGLLSAIGLVTIADRVEELTGRLTDGLPADMVAGPRDHHSGLVSLRVADPDAVVESLREADIIVRRIPLLDTVRVSVHVFNSPADIDRCLAALADR